MKDADRATDPFDDITLVPNNTEELLNERQYLDYRSEREHCLDWLDVRERAGEGREVRENDGLEPSVPDGPVLPLGLDTGRRVHDGPDARPR